MKVKTQPRGTDGSLLASLPWTLTALAVALAPHLPYLPIWITATFVGCAAWRMIIERRRKLLPKTWVRGVLALGCFLGVLGTYSSISGVGPGSALLVVMAAMKLLETRKRRDQFVLLFISIFLVMSSLLREQYLWSLPYLVGGTLVIMTAWLRMAAGEHETTRQSFRTSSRLLMYAAPLAIAMWIFFPRLSSPFWAVPIDTSQASSGLSDVMSPGDISDLSLSNEVAFRATFEGAIPPPRDRYWRALVLTRFNGRTWSSGDPVLRTRRDASQIEYHGDPYRYTVTMEPTRQQFVLALEMARSVEGLNQLRYGTQQLLWKVTPIEQRIAYTVESHTDYTVQPEMHAMRRNWYTDVPDSSNEETAEFARDMRAAAASDEEFVNNVLSHFNQEEFYYTLEPPPLGADPVDRFLFDTKRGFCEHYASAFAFMMRSAGIPARVVLGYQGGEVNPLGGHLVVRQSDAHAWTEVWFEDRGWQRVDPTAAVAPERIEFSAGDPEFDGAAAAWGFSGGIPLMENIILTWDALNAQWNEWILGYGPEKQDQFMELLGLEDPNWRKMMLTLVSLVVAMIVAISGLMMLRYRPPRKDPAQRLYLKFVRKTGLEPATGETAMAFAQRVIEAGSVPASDVQVVTRSYMEYRYGNGRDFESLKAAVDKVA